MTKRTSFEWIAETAEAAFLLGFLLLALSLIWEPLGKIGFFLQIVAPIVILAIGGFGFLLWRKHRANRNPSNPVTSPLDSSTANSNARGAWKFGGTALLLVLADGIGTVMLINSRLSWRLTAILALQVVTALATIALTLVVRRRLAVIPSG